MRLSDEQRAERDTRELFASMVLAEVEERIKWKLRPAIAGPWRGGMVTALDIVHEVRQTLIEGGELRRG